MKPEEREFLGWKWSGGDLDQPSEELELHVEYVNKNGLIVKNPRVMLGATGKHRHLRRAT